MELSTGTSSLLSELDTLSGGTLTRHTDLGILLETGSVQPLRDVLDELAFFSKFLQRSYAIMARIGRNGEGYDRLAKEFTDAAERTRSLLGSLIAASPEDVRQRLTTVYLAMTPEGLDNLLSLCRDLSWYKNWLIDTQRKRKAGT